jgi:hypothetical protein
MESPQEVMPLSPRSKTPFVIAGVIVVIALIALALWIVPQLLDTRAAAPSDITAATLPADLLFYASFNPHFQELPNGDVLLKAWSDPQIAQSFESNIRDALSEANLDWDQDIASWLGDEAGVGIRATSLQTDSPTVIAVIATRDAAQAGAFLAKVRSAREAEGAAFNEETYRDVAVTELQTASEQLRMAYALQGDFVLFANGPNASTDLRAAIDAAFDGNGFVQSTHYQSTLSKLRGGRALSVYADIETAFETLAESLDDSFAGTPGMNPFAVDTQGFAMGVSFDPNGVLAEFITTGDPSAKLPVEERTGAAAAPNPNTLLRAVPDSTFLYMSGRRISDAFEDIVALIKTTTPEFENELNRFESEAGINLQEDLIGWMTGEAAVAVMPGSGLLGPNPSPVGLAVLIQSDDPQRAEKGSHRLVQALAPQLQANVEDVDVAGHALHGVVDSFSDMPLVIYGVLDDKFVLAMPESAAEQIATVERPLADDEVFKEAVAPLPANNIGYVYFNPDTLVNYLAGALAVSGQSCDACTYLKSIRALTFSIEYPPVEAGVIRSMLFMLLDTK